MECSMENFYYKQHSHIIITKDIQKYKNGMIASTNINDYKVIENLEDKNYNFKLSHANQAIKEANIASKQTKYIILCANKYGIEAQNRLLKLLEEPPPNIVFVLVVSSRLNLLATIVSRLKVYHIKSDKKQNKQTFGLHRMAIRDIYNFLQKNKNATKEEVKHIIYNTIYEIKGKQFVDKKLLETFDLSIALLELNSKPIHILSMFCLSISQKANKKYI